MRPFPLIKLLSAALCALLVPLVGLYFCGFWMPNWPSPVQYPIRGVVGLPPIGKFLALEEEG
jgi:hypothetical protein